MRIICWGKFGAKLICGYHNTDSAGRLCEPNIGIDNVDREITNQTEYKLSNSCQRDQLGLHCLIESHMYQKTPFILNILQENSTDCVYKSYFLPLNPINKTHEVNKRIFEILCQMKKIRRRASIALQ